ncbi:hypothetical protein NKDENANG_01839 [Candidatus Entotheonellaceae bacterium PAL068K]
MKDQHADFVFKLRQNITLEGDIKLAEMELSAFIPSRVTSVADITKVTQHLPQLDEIGGFGALDSRVRISGVQGYTATAPLSKLSDLIRRLTFIQRIYAVTQDTAVARSLLSRIENTLGPVIACHTDDSGVTIISAVPHYAIFEFSDVVARRSRDAVETKRNLNLMLSAVACRSDNLYAKKLALAALSAQSTTAHLSHDIHYYKAKFFPRLARSILNICAQRMAALPHRVIDPFVGSGTTLLEAATLGIPSVGLDIDPLSVLIAKAKLKALQLDSELLTQEVDRTLKILDSQRCGNEQKSEQLWLFERPKPTEFLKPTITFPKWLMKNRKMTEEIAVSLGRDISTIQNAIAACHPRVDTLFRVLMSDTISRKIRMRFLGTGVGRFSLTFAKTPMVELFTKSLQKCVKVAATSEWLSSTLHLQLAPAEVFAADARCIPFEMGTVDILVTSPPYLPASSGRESYAMARAPSLCVLGMKSHDEVDDLIDDSIGSMNGDFVPAQALNPDERRLVEWLSRDELRQIKAAPTARYFLDMRAAFSEMYRILTPGGIAVVVSAKQSTFYNFEKREVLYMARSAELLADEALALGFEISYMCDVQLNKSNKNARPRSLDDYYETLIFLRKSFR